MAFTIDKRLQNECHVLAEDHQLSYLLHHNAEFLWFILVPHTRLTQFYQLEPTLLRHICHKINDVSAFIQARFEIERLNVTTVGQDVSQLHIHLTEQTQKETDWPEEVWGKSCDKTYGSDEISTIQQQLSVYLKKKAVKAKACLTFGR